MLHGVDVRLQIGICAVDAADGVGPGALEIVAASDVAAGAEIHNTYGEHGNADLVRLYGFALRNNPFDEVRLRTG